MEGTSKELMENPDVISAYLCLPDPLFYSLDMPSAQTLNLAT
ncbi:MAG: hypothetical protein DRG66_03465 [Deltaproteobacteria bacterium]|nr:MAG: hypothetical protein DRG66_03465 [Deltaproteobacteria bacterium]